MSSNYPELTFSDTEDFNADRLNKAMQVLDQRLRSLEPFTPSWEAAVNDLRAVGLSRLNDAILPAYNRIQLLSSIGFLFAGSNTTLTLVQNQSATFTIDEETQRSLFTPTPFLAITRSSTPNDYAIAQLVSYDNDTGQLVVTVKAITGNAGPHSDWQIGALAGSTLAAMAYWTQMDAARNATLTAKAAADADAAQTGLDRTQTGLDAAAANASKIAAQSAAATAQTWDPTFYIQKNAAGTYTQTITFTMSPIVPTVAATDNSQNAASTAFVKRAIDALVNGAGTSLDTLQELAAALGNDANFSATITASLGNRVRVDTAAQGLNATQQANARTNLGLPANSAGLKNVASASQIMGGATADIVAVDQAWAAAGWVNLGNLTGSVVINCANGSRFWGTLVGNVTISVSNAKNGQVLELGFIQDGVGGRTISWSGFYFPDNVAPTIYTSAGYWALLYSGSYHPNLGWIGNGWKIN